MYRFNQFLGVKSVFFLSGKSRKFDRYSKIVFI